MYTLPMRKWVGHMHVPGRHGIAVSLSHMVQDERFWPIVAAGAVLLLLITMVIWAGVSGGTGQEAEPLRPFFPYQY